MKTIKIKIDNNPIEVLEGTTILAAAENLGITIPTLCYLNLPHFGVENKPGGCRICCVEIEGRKNLSPACSTNCQDGMVIHTNTVRVLNARRTVLRLILSDHPKDCLSCAKSGNCDLQSIAIKFNIRHIPEQKFAEMSHHKPDSSPAIIREMDKCILCRRCETMCGKVQSVFALSAINRGFNAVVAPAFERSLVDSECTYCGQCVAVCPTGALTEFDYTDYVLRALADPKKTVVVQTAPAVRAALGEEFGLPPGTDVTGKMVAALKRLGFDYVFDTNFSADITIMEEASELLARLKGHLEGDSQAKRLPILTSCCPAWVNFIETFYPDMLDIPSTARSPQQMFGAIAKTWFAKKIGVDRKDMVVLSIMPCLAKKYECQRDEFKVDGSPDVDYSISTRELSRLISEANIDFENLKEESFDSPMGHSSGAAAIFGTTGGVIEAAVRTAYSWHVGEKLESVEFEALRGWEGVRVATINFGNLPINIGIAHGLRNARKMLDSLRSKELSLHAIEIMACPGGCIGGGGQPLHHGDDNILLARRRVLYEADKTAECRESHLNPDVIELYKEFLGEPMGQKAHQLLHTHYKNRGGKTS